MSVNKISSVAINSISCALPKNSVRIVDRIPSSMADMAYKITKVTGFSSLRIAPKNTTTSDLVVEAAKPVLDDFGRNNIKAIVFVSETPDYIFPATSHVLQDTLGLPDTTFCVDINEGCSGYVTGLYISSLLAKNLGGVLLCGGDTRSKLVPADDFTPSSIFADGAFVTLISPTNLDNKANNASNEDAIAFNFASYGERRDALIMENSRHRVVENPKNNGNPYMDGKAVLKFAVSAVPKVVDELLTQCGLTKDDITYYACHQANRSLLLFLADAMNLPHDRIPFASQDIGNTISATIPLLLSIQREQADLSRVLCAGFGVGLAVGACIVNLAETKFYGIIEV